MDSEATFRRCAAAITGILHDSLYITSTKSSQIEGRGSYRPDGISCCRRVKGEPTKKRKFLLGYYFVPSFCRSKSPRTLPKAWKSFCLAELTPGSPSKHLSAPTTPHRPSRLVNRALPACPPAADLQHRKPQSGTRHLHEKVLPVPSQRPGTMCRSRISFS